MILFLLSSLYRSKFILTQFKEYVVACVCKSVGLCVWSQISPVGYFGNGPCGDQDGYLCEEQGILGGTEMPDTEEESSHSNFIQERRKYVVFIDIVACSLHYFNEP